VHCDLREDCVLCGEKRIARLTRQAQRRSARGYKRLGFRKLGCLQLPHPIELHRELPMEQPD